jgi:hypothetical protein
MIDLLDGCLHMTHAKCTLPFVIVTTIFGTRHLTHNFQKGRVVGLNINNIPTT